MDKGLGKSSHWLSVVFAAACLVSGVLGMGTVTQSNSIALALPQNLRGYKIILCGREVPICILLLSVLLAMLTACVIFGGGRRIAKTAEKVIPPMALLYLAFTLTVLCLYHRQIPKAISCIFSSAFSLRSIGGGLLGTGIAKSLITGVQRGVFSNEAGLGTSAMAASASDESEPIQQAYAGIVSVFVDTVVLCTLTGLMIIVTGVWEVAENGAAAASAAWQEGLPLPPQITEFLLFLFLAFFGYTSIIGWNYYAEQSARYLFHSNSGVLLYQCLYLLAVFLGPFLSAEFSWMVADYTNALMILPNLLALCLLRKDVLRLLK